MRYLQGLIFTLAVLIQLLSLVSAVCQNFGNTCPEDAPCCNGGWCSNDPKFCSTGCDPVNSFSQNSCYPDPPCVSLYDDFSTPSLVNWNNYTGDPNSANWTSDFTPDYSGYTTDHQLALSMKYDSVNKNAQGNYQGFGSTVSSTRWMEYGSVTAHIKTGSTSLGVVSSFITKNLHGDEIDYEWVGLNRNEVQSNWYFNGTLNYTQGVHHQVGADTTADYHTYTINWQPDSISWIIDGTTARTVNRNATFNPTTGIYMYPDRPSRIQFSVWDGGMGAPGTANWAGTPTDWSNQNTVYTMYVKWVNITCYYNGNTTGNWPPQGYGPQKLVSGNSTSGSAGSYTTLGANQPVNVTPGGTGAQVQADAPDYNQSSLPHLVAPIAVVCSTTVLGAVAFGIWKYKRGKQVFTKA